MNKLELYTKLRRNEIQEKRERIGAEISEEEYRIGRGMAQYVFYDSELADFSDDFEVVVPNQQDLKTYVEKTFSKKAGKVFGLELGGPGQKLFGGFSKGFFERTAGVCLADPRDQVGNHTLIKGDILSEKTRDDVATWSKGQPIDFIILRMLAGQRTLPLDPFFMAEKTRECYRMLPEEGILLSEIPRAFLPAYIDEWSDMVKDKYKGKLETQIFFSYPLPDRPRGLIRIQKLPGAPAELPLLPASDILPQEMNRVFDRSLDRSFH